MFIDNASESVRRTLDRRPYSRTYLIETYSRKLLYIFVQSFEMAFYIELNVHPDKVKRQKFVDSGFLKKRINISEDYRLTETIKGIRLRPYFSHSILLEQLMNLARSELLVAQWTLLVPSDRFNYAVLTKHVAALGRIRRFCTE